MIKKLVIINSTIDTLHIINFDTGRYTEDEDGVELLLEYLRDDPDNQHNNGFINLNNCEWHIMERVIIDFN